MIGQEFLQFMYSKISFLREETWFDQDSPILDQDMHQAYLAPMS